MLRSPLIRTVWSVLDRSSAEYLKEIILVDDASDKKHLQVGSNDHVVIRGIHS